MKRMLWILLPSLLLLSCASGAVTPPSTPAPTASSLKEPVAAWEQQWNSVQREAKKDGKVVIYSSAGSTLVNAMKQGFKDKYGIDAEFLVGRGEEMTEKIKAERRAGLFVPDLFIGGSGIPLLLIKSQSLIDRLEPMLILPDVTNPKNWWGGELPWLDKDRTTFGFSLWVQIPIAYNPNFVKGADLKSYNELLKPQYKGKIVIDDPSITGSGASIISVLGATIMGWDYIRQIAQQDPVIERDARVAMTGLAQGKYTIYIGVKPEMIGEYKQAGASIDTAVPDEGAIVTAGSGAINPFNSRPHDNASRLFVNWLLSKDGQTIITPAFSAPSARIDVPTIGLDPNTLLKPGVKYFKTHDEDFVTKRAEYMKTAAEIFKKK